MKVYSYNWATGEYIGETEADFSPLEPGEWLIPAYATPKAPPDMNEFPGKRACFDVEKDDWVIENIPAPPKPTMKEQLAKIPSDMDGLLGGPTIGDLFNDNGDE
jgi:hypothetical protein